MAEQWAALGSFIGAIYGAMATSLTIPFIGTTSPLALLIMGAALSWVAYFVTMLMGGEGESMSMPTGGMGRTKKVSPSTSARRGVFRKN